MSTDRLSSSIFCEAPTRIDLSGGTLDLWPIYLLNENSMTLNLAVDMMAEAELIFSVNGPVRDPVVEIISEDQNARTQFQLSNFDEMRIPESLLLPLRFLKYYLRKKQLKQNLRIRTHCQSPAGAGLGGSSALCIALSGVFQIWSSNKSLLKLEEKEGLIELSKDIESSILQVPAGLQDYYSAAFGGLQALHWQPVKADRVSFESGLAQELTERILLFYSGHTRNSGANNWEIYKLFIDKNIGIREKFRGIQEVSHLLSEAILKRDWKGIGALIAREWDLRKSLFAGISTPEIEEAIRVACEVPFVAAKICGAGGGGCFFLFLSDTENKTKLQSFADLREKLVLKMEKLGMRHLKFNLALHGVSSKLNA